MVSRYIRPTSTSVRHPHPSDIHFRPTSTSVRHPHPSHLRRFKSLHQRSLPTCTLTTAIYVIRNHTTHNHDLIYNTVLHEIEPVPPHNLC
ncbi:hypothetical protein BC936DRAFT_141830 [Jimgerdemannia flammicorona]|uniref:Uncharacterized protein n=1 Tax=Jimgerdemannia flammicorona TaxID=994334 RepID=A0A433A1K6_9FUNG|nr:hypothetical protein BC936DRAFT_141830 [Jimgerdemannia flammicorona]